MATPRSAREGRGLVTLVAQELSGEADEAAACGFTVDLRLVISY